MATLTPDNQASIVLKNEADDVNESNTAGSFTTDLNDSTTTGTTVDGVLLIDELEATLTKEESMVHGVGNQEPQARAQGNESYEVTFTLEGEDAQLFDELYIRDDTVMEVRFQTNEKEHRFGDVDYTDLTINVSDDDYVSYDGTLTALDYKDIDISRDDSGNLTKDPDQNSETPQ